MFLVGAVSETLHSRTRGTRQSQTELQAWNKPVPVDPALLPVGSIPALPLEKTSHGPGLSCRSLLERLQLAPGRAGGAACSGVSSCSPEPFQKGSMPCARPDSCGQENGAQGDGSDPSCEPQTRSLVWPNPSLLNLPGGWSPWGPSLLPANERQEEATEPQLVPQCGSPFFHPKLPKM